MEYQADTSGCLAQAIEWTAGCIAGSTAGWLLAVALGGWPLAHDLIASSVVAGVLGGIGTAVFAAVPILPFVDFERRGRLFLTGALAATPICSCGWGYVLGWVGSVASV